MRSLAAKYWIMDQKRSQSYSRKNMDVFQGLEGASFQEQSD